MNNKCKAIVMIFLVNLIAHYYSKTSLKQSSVSTSDPTPKNNTTPTTTAPAPAETKPTSPITNSLYPVTEDDAFQYKRKIQCSQANCPYPSMCVDESTCSCALGWANFPEEGVYGMYCQYPQKKQLTCFLLELLIGCGTGHFAAGRIVNGTLKVILILIPCIMSILFCAGILPLGKMTDCCPLVMTIVMYATLLGYLGWTFADIIMFGMNYWKDGNGVPLLHW